MSPLKSNSFSPRDRFSNYWFYALLAAAIALVPILFGADSRVVKVVFILVVLLTRWRFSGAIILVAIEAYLLFRTRSDSPTSLLLLDNGLLAVCALLTIVFADWFRTHRRIERYVDEYRLPMVDDQRTSQAAMQSILRQQDASMQQSFFKSLLMTMGLALIAVIIARALLLLVPLNPYEANRLRFRPGELRAIYFGLVLLSIYGATWLVVREVQWRSLSAQQARFHLRGVLVQWLSRDLRRVAKLKHKQQLRMLKAVSKNSTHEQRS